MTHLDCQEKDHLAGERLPQRVEVVPDRPIEDNPARHGSNPPHQEITALPFDGIELTPNAWRGACASRLLWSSAPFYESRDPQRTSDEDDE